ncbi:hypothetical protein J4Q44_G00393060, partial [Coregonus suidteri]
ENIAQCHAWQGGSQPQPALGSLATQQSVLLWFRLRDEKVSKGSSCMEVCRCSEIRSIYSFLAL